MEEFFEEVQAYSKEEAPLLRAKIILDWVIPQIQATFRDCPSYNFAALFFAQFYDDESEDAVHPVIHYLPQLFPDLAKEFPNAVLGNSNTFDEILPTVFPISQEIQNSYSSTLCDDLIPAFGAYCTGIIEEGYLKDWDGVSLFSTFRRVGDEIQVEYVGIKHRPWLDGASRYLSLSIEGPESSS